MRLGEGRINVTGSVTSWGLPENRPDIVATRFGVPGVRVISCEREPYTEICRDTYAVPDICPVPAGVENRSVQAAACAWKFVCVFRRVWPRRDGYCKMRCTCPTPSATIALSRQRFSCSICRAYFRV